jgi:cholesterol transport system auxiliary component
MFQPLLVQALQNTHYFRAIVTQPFIGRYDYILSTQILQLQQNFIYYPAKLQLTVRAQLINATTNQVIATQLFYKQQMMAKQTPYAGVIAANHAMEDVLRQIATFCLKTLT